MGRRRNWGNVCGVYCVEDIEVRLLCMVEKVTEGRCEVRGTSGEI